MSGFAPNTKDVRNTDPPEIQSHPADEPETGLNGHRSAVAADAYVRDLERRVRDLSDFIENAEVALRWVGEDGTILWANEAELNFLGYKRQEYLGHNIAEFHVDQPVINDILRRLKNDERLTGYEAKRQLPSLHLGCSATH
jgi:PAS domain-containing protein